MSAPETNSSVWASHEGACPECGFDWGDGDVENLIGQCVRNVAVFGAVLSHIDPAEAVAPGLWSASRYVWHTVDVLRSGTERLWTISAEPAFRVPAWDENELATAHAYDDLSPVVGLIALIEAAKTWQETATETPDDVSTPTRRPSGSAHSTSSSAIHMKSATTYGTYGAAGPDRRDW